jgi:hypothetical protein
VGVEDTPGAFHEDMVTAAFGCGESFLCVGVVFVLDGGDRERGGQAIDELGKGVV